MTDPMYNGGPVSFQSITWEAEARGPQVRVSLDHMVRPHLKTKQKELGM